jgi:hypothetical protein
MSTIKVDTLQTRAGSTSAVTGAGFVATDQIRGNTAANSVTVVGEGGTNTMNLQQGLCKAWTTFNGTGTIATTDSYNIASLTDTAVGVYSTNFTNDMGNSEHADAFALREATDGAANDIDGLVNYQRAAQGAGFTALTTQSSGTTPGDRARIAVMTFGDLA